MPVPVAQLQPAIAHEAVVEYLLVHSTSQFRLNEVVGEVGANEFRPRTAGQGLDGGIDVVDLAVGSDRDERVEARLEETSIVNAGQPGFVF